MSGLIATVRPRYIKASHRRRRRIASGQSVQRYYDPGIGRFLSVDPVTADANTGANFNRYQYANNNPYLFVDPDGRKGKVAWLVDLGTNQMRKLARLSKEKAVLARKSGKNVVADRRQVASQIETAAHGKNGQLKHAAHELEDGNKGLPHYQTEGVKGHSFWGKLSVALTAAATGLDQVAEAAENIDPYRISDAGSESECASSCAITDAQMQETLDLGGFQGVFRVDGRIDSKQLERDLDKKKE